MTRRSKDLLFMIVVAFAVGMALNSSRAPGVREFVSKAASADMMAVTLRRIAAERAVSDEVRRLAVKTLADHTASGRQITAVAENNNIGMPRDLDREDNSEARHLSKFHGPPFDRAYIEYMLRDQQEEIEMFKKEARYGRDRDLRNYARKNLPALEDHFLMTRQIAERLGEQGG